MECTPTRSLMSIMGVKYIQAPRIDDFGVFMVALGYKFMERFNKHEHRLSWHACGQFKQI
jgi:hypothetical protein